MKPKQNKPTGPLAGIRVLDLTQTLMGPYCTQILADLGADVIKVESRQGDTTRFIPPGIEPDVGGMFENLNRGKRSIVLDLKTEDGKGALLRLVEKSDVFLHSMRPKAIERLGLTYDVLEALNSQLIYANLTGFGREGQYSDFPAYDDVMQAVSGLALLQGDLNQGPPSYLASVVSDKVTGLTGVYAILAALFSRERTGAGQEVEINMFETMTSFVMIEHISGAVFDPPLGKPVYPRVVSPERRPYATVDGHISMMVYNDKQWQNFFAALGHPAWSKAIEFSSITQRTINIDMVYGKLAEIVATQTTDYWLELCRRMEIPAMPLLSTTDLMHDPHLEEVGFWKNMGEGDGKVRYPGIPTHFSKTPGSIRSGAPSLGADTVDVLRQEGFSSAEIEKIAALKKD
ncbi:MAG: CoA transferase [Kordiimonadaceae bacterium]|nr:CoA transferase [Kordiimonadaceae bacterium]